MNSEVQWWEFSLSIKLMAFVLFSVDDCICVVLVHKHVRTLKLNEYRADPTQLNGIFFFPIVFRSFELGLQALCSTFEQALLWLHASGERFILSDLLFPSIHAKADRKSCVLEHGKFREENPCFAKALSAL